MIIGIPKEIKNDENRVGIVPSGVRTLVSYGHEVLIEKNAGVGSWILDEAYEREGAKILDSKEAIYKNAEMIMKVKEPLPEEFNLLQKDQILYTYLHLAACSELTKILIKRGVTAIGYETIELADGSLPLLRPMSEVAGKMAVQIGAIHLQKDRGGKGILLGGIPGVMRGTVTIIGGGIVGINAAKMAIGLGGQVRILDINPIRLGYLDDIFGNKIITLMSNPINIEESIRAADLVIGGLLITGAKAPKVVSKKMVSNMSPGSVIVDVSIDQGGCCETSRPTTHSNPTYEVDGVIHYCVTNIPGVVSKTSTYGLTNVTLPYALKIAQLGFNNAIAEDQALAKGVNVYDGKIIHKGVAAAFEKK
jgi:alanine dehydrogenase